MTETNASETMHPAEVIARWHLTLAKLADNDNAPRGMWARALALVLGLPLASTVAVATGLRFCL